MLLNLALLLYRYTTIATTAAGGTDDAIACSAHELRDRGVTDRSRKNKAQTRREYYISGPIYKLLVEVCRARVPPKNSYDRRCSALQATHPD